MNSEQIEKRLREVEESKHGSYDKRTEHLDESGRGVFINRLIEEDSPYLLQHAHNPVNWYAWGDEAFAAAQATGPPLRSNAVFLHLFQFFALTRQFLGNP